MAETERATFVFTVKEYHEGTPWIAFELLRGPELSILANGFLGFDLLEGTTLEQAKEIASFLNENIREVSYTRL